MADGWVLLAALLAMAGVTAVAGGATRLLGHRAGYVFAAVFAGVAVLLATAAPALVHGGVVTAELRWLPALGVSVALRLDALSLLFALLVLAVGAVVLGYCPAYLHDSEERHGRFYTAMTGFGTAMLGLVLADDVWVLYAAWELTTVASYALIAHRGETAHRRAATRAFAVTFLGGLCLLAGLLAAAAAAGTTRLSDIVAALAMDGGSATTVLALVVVAAAAKSAQLPLHPWLPDAMVAPTPVSAYLHSAAMVKAGLYLLARMSPVVAARGGSDAIVLLGLVTAVFGAAVALRRTDVKEILAYSTMSQLGLIFGLLGVGSFPAVAAGLLHVLAHAAYKAPLFLVAGAIEHSTGSRDVREVSGLAASMPLLAGVAAAAIASMAGLPPLLGYVSKEEAFAALLGDVHGGVGVVATGLAVLAVALTVAYALRLAVLLLPGDPTPADRPAAALVVAPLVPACASLAAGVWSGRLSAPVAAAAGAALGAPEELELGLWHGPTPALGAGITATAGGLVVLVVVRRWWRAREPRPLRGIAVVSATMAAAHRAGGGAGGLLGRAAPVWHLTAIIAVAVAGGAATWWAGGVRARAPAWPQPPVEWVIVALLAFAVVATVRARDRLAAVVLLGIADFLVAALFVLHGAPDLVLTQLLVDALTIALIVQVFRELPRGRAAVERRGAVAAGVLAAVAGAGTAAATYLLPTDERSDLAAFYLDTGPDEAAGNVVNGIITDFRAFDTVGEVVVIAVAALGVVTLLRGVRRGSA